MKRDKWKERVDLQKYLNALRDHVSRFEQPNVEMGPQNVRGAEQIFISMFDNAEDGILIADVESKKVFVGNKSICRLLGYSHDEIESLSIMDFHPQDKLSFVMEQFEKQVRREMTLARDIPLKRKDGSFLYVDINSFPIILDQKKYLMGIFRDVTERRQTEEALKQSEEKFRLAMEVTNEALWDWNLLTNEVYRNPRHATMLGYEPGELSSSHEEWEKRIHPDDKKILFDILNEHLEGKKDSYECEYRLKTKLGDFIWILGRGKVVERDTNGSPVRMIGTNIDITKRKQMEQSLSESEKHYRMLAETINDGLSHIDENGIKIYVNSRCAEILGYSPDEMVGRHWLDFYDQDVQEILTEQWDKRKKGCSEPYEIANTRKDGRKIYIRISPRPVFDENGAFKGSVAILTDITERKKALEEIRRLARFPAENPNPVLRVNRDGNILYANEKSSRLLKFWKCDIGKRLPEIQLEYVRKAIEKNKTIYNEEVCENAVYELTYSPVKDSDFVNLYGLDITGRKKMEEALRKSEETLRSLINAITESVILIDTKGIVIAVNESCAKRIGCRVEDLIGRCSYDFLQLNVMEYRKSKVEEVVRTGLPLQFEDRPSGRIVNNSLYPIFDTAGNVVQVAIFALDITERKRVEQALAENEQKYRTLVESAGDAIATIDKNGEFLFMNTTAADRLGGKPEDFIGKTMGELFPQDVAERQLENIREVIDKRKGLNKVSLTKIRNQLRWYNTVIEPLKDSEGKTTAALMIARDIHEIKQAEEQIHKLSSAIEQSIDGIAMSSLEPRILYVNNAYARMHGYTQEEMVGMRLDELHDKESIDQCKEIVRQIKTRGAWVDELEHVRKDGTILPIYLSVTLLKDDKGKAVGSVGICRDMTEYKKTREDLMVKDAAIASSITGIAIGNNDAKLTYANDSFLKMWGYEDSSEILGKNPIDFLQKKDDALALVERLHETGSWIGELVAKRKDGTEFYVQVCATLIKDSNEKAISVMGSFVDITESRRNQEQLNAYREKMARTEQLASLGTLSATVAHELTQPLTVIRLSLESAFDKLRKKSHTETCVKKIEDSLNQVSNMVMITKRFRNFARRSSGSSTQRIDLKSVATRLAGLLAESSRRMNITIHIEDMESLPVVYCDENEIEQMFFGLINNAIQAADGKEYRLLIISGKIKDKHIELKFADNCGGIAPENKDRIFEPFFTTKSPGKGTGLGLCIVQDIVYRAGGKIRVESEYGEGATFIVTLPVVYLPDDIVGID